MNLLEFKENIFSQNGEDGIIKKIFEKIGTTNKVCCEFGAWDGVHLCNVRNLIINQGWYGVLIEGDSSKCARIQDNYSKDQVCIINSFVDSKENSLANLLDRCSKVKDKDIDFLSVDIDGLDYLILESLTIKPRVICIEANAGHNPTNLTYIPEKIAKYNVSQSLGYFNKIAKDKGYSLVGYNGNAFFVRQEIVAKSELKELSVEEAYKDCINHLSTDLKGWLYLANIAKVDPYYPFNNPFLKKEYLNLSDEDIKNAKTKYAGGLRNLFNRTRASIRRLLA